MSKHSEREHHSHGNAPRKGLHRDWRFWTAVILMLAAMGMYVASMDEALGPGGEAGPAVPAAE